MSSNHEYLPALVLFTRIVRFGSFSRAAEFSGLSRSAVSKQLSALENKLGVRLLQRSTRKVTLTDAGERILSQAQRIVDATDTIESLSEEFQGQVRGQLKVTCSTGIGKMHLVPLLGQFSKRYPNVHIQLLLEDRFVDLIDEQIDVAIRVGHLPDSSYVARHLGNMNWMVAASPAYLNTYGVPETPSDLLKHNCIFYRNNYRSLNSWLFSGPEGEQRIDVDGPLSINEPMALVNAAENDMGILLIDRNILMDSLAGGRLVQVLENYSFGAGFPIYVLYPARAHLPIKTRAFVDFLVEDLAPKLQGGSESG